MKNNTKNNIQVNSPSAGENNGVLGNTMRNSDGVIDMTQGSPVRLMLSFMIPMLIGNIFQQLYNMVDSMIVGHFVGADALAAIGATGSINWMFFSLCNGLANGVGIVISQYFGAGRDNDVKTAIGNAFYIVAAAALLMGGLGYALARPVLALLGTPDNIIDMSVQYMRICCLGVIAIALYNCIASILRGLGDSRTPLYFLIVASVLNVVLDLVFVCVFHWGVAGAGVATIISQLLSGVGSLTLSIRRNAYFHLTKESFRFNRNIIFQTVRIGVPMAAQSSLIAFSCVILQSVVNSFGSSVVAAFTATSRVEQLVQQPYMSLSTAISTFTGQNIGAGKKDRVRLGASRGLIMILAFTCVMMPLIWIFSHPIIGLFVTDKEVIRLGAHALHLTSPFYFPLSIIYVYRGLLNGAGDAMFSFLNGVTECTGRIAFPKPLTMISQIGVWGIWLGTALTWLLVAIVTFLRYRSGAWKKISLQGRSA